MNMSHPSALSLNESGMLLTGVRRAAFNCFNERIYSGIYTVSETKSCFCAERQLERLSSFDRFGFPFGTLICRSCGLISIDKVLSAASLPSFYDELYWPLISGTSTPVYETAQEDFSDFIGCLAPLSQRADIVMEIGCGSGQRLASLKSALGRAECKYIGCDYSHKALELAAKRGIDVIQGGAAELALRGKADVLILSHVFEHFVDLHDALKDISRLIHRNSIVYIEVPGVIDLENKREYGYDYQDYCVLAHIHNFSLATLSRVVGTIGLQLIQGSEYVRAVFSTNVPRPQPIEPDPYKSIMCALQRAHVRAQKHRNSGWTRMRAALSAMRGAL